MKLYINKELEFETSNERIWTASNGATRTNLVLINKLPDKMTTSEINADIGFLEKGNHAFIFINKEKKPSTRIVGLFLCSEYGYDIKKGKELFSASSVGGYGNSESKFGLYEIGTIIACNSYKNRRGDSFYELTDNGWEYLGIDISIDDNEITQL